jgi:lipopolysaccharide/colanic/teichoic acid biosynthesis glycosyltransferase
MAKRLFDLCLAALGLVLTAPLLAFAALGIRLASPGPLFYRARRVGKDGTLFTMYKLRSMHRDPGLPASRITGQADPRVFRFGRWLRQAKLDELPQLVNVLRGDMAIVGPRPEDPAIVARHYTTLERETLRVRPGLASPGSLFHFTHGERWLGNADPEREYVDRLMPVKLALDVVYVRRASFGYDLRVIGRTAWVICSGLAGKRSFPAPPELAAAQELGLVNQTLRPAAARRNTPSAHL